MFMLFVYEDHEEKGGWNDFVGIFDSVLEAKTHEEKTRNHYSLRSGDIVVVATMQRVSKLNTFARGTFWNTWEYIWTDSQPSSP